MTWVLKDIITRMRDCGGTEGLPGCSASGWERHTDKQAVGWPCWEEGTQENPLGSLRSRPGPGSPEKATRWGSLPVEHTCEALLEAAWLEAQALTHSFGDL